MLCLNDMDYVSLDIEEKYNPDICISILDWNYKEYFKLHYSFSMH